MAGHSKWATTKRHKAAVDAKRGKLFSLISKELTISARDGGADPEFNPRLRTIIAKAKAANMPQDNVDRAIKKGTGELPGVTIEELTYEGYGPGGVGIIVEVTTDNKNRSASEIRSTFTKAGGNLAGSGALAYNFQRKGQFLIASEKTTEEDLMNFALDSGAEDIVSESDHFEVFCSITDFDKLSQAFTDSGVSPDSSELAYIPSSLVEIQDEEVAKAVLKLIDKLEELEDVKSVHTNYDIPDSILNKVG